MWTPREAEELLWKLLERGFPEPLFRKIHPQRHGAQNYRAYCAKTKRFNAESESLSLCDRMNWILAGATRAGSDVPWATLVNEALVRHPPGPSARADSSFGRGDRPVSSGSRRSRISASRETRNPETVVLGERRERLIAFQGYGNLRGPLWFLGIEEGFGGRLENPRWSVEREVAARARWQQTMDARQACESLEDRYWERRKYSQVWRNAAKLARALLRNATDWGDKDVAHDYVVECLGRAGGETFLGDLFPLPAIGLPHWPYEADWRNRRDYRRDLWAGRREMWRSLLDEHRPRTVICYGKNVRPFARELFPGTTPLDNLEVGRTGPTLVILAPFIGMGCPVETLKAIVEAARA